MKIKTTLIHGLTVNMLIEEANDRDLAGDILCYVASIYVVNNKTSAKTLLRRSRLPGTAEVMRREFQRDGLRAFRRHSQV